MGPYHVRITTELNCVQDATSSRQKWPNSSRASWKKRKIYRPGAGFNWKIISLAYHKFERTGAQLS